MGNGDVALVVAQSSFLVVESFSARELPQLVFRRPRLLIRASRFPRLRQCLRIGDRDVILEQTRPEKPDALLYSHRIAVRREAFDERIRMERDGVDDERLAFPAARRITGVGRIVQYVLRRLASIEI